MSDPQYDITREEFDAGRHIRFGKTNPDRMQNPFWEKMISTDADPFWLEQQFGIEVDFENPRPVWCFSRVGQSETVLEHGEGVLFIGGEHEMGGDPNFAIYNDVIIRGFDGSIEIYGYPRDDFQPTDFHTATQVGNHIYIIGGLGYMSDRIIGTTPIYRLDRQTKQITRIEVAGQEPGWIYMHEAVYWKDDHSIVIWGGELWERDCKQAINNQMWAFDIYKQTWRTLESLKLIKSSSRYLI